MTDCSRLGMPIGEAMFTWPSMRKFKQDPIPKEHLELIVEADGQGPPGAIGLTGLIDFDRMSRP